MAYNTTSCSEDFGNTGAQKFCGNVGKDRILVLVPKGTEIATKTLALTESTWTDNFNESKSVRWFPLIPIVNGEVNQEDSVRQDFDYGYSAFVRDGKLTMTYTLEEMSVYNKNELNKLSLADFDVYIATDKEFIKGWSSDGVKFLPYSVDYFSVLPESQNTGSENAHVRVEVKFTDVNQLNLNQVVINPSKDSEAPTVWYPSLVFEGIKDLQIIVSDETTTGATVTLKGYDNVAYSAAVVGDLYMRKSSVTGSAISLTSLTETATAGVYTLVYPTQTAGTFYLSLYDQPSATTEGVETPSYATFTLSS